MVELRTQEVVRQNIEILRQKEDLQNQTKILQRINSKLTNLSRFKEQMTGMIVHDLKNPLNSIIGLADNLKTKTAGKKMLNMVSNILDVYKFEDAKVKLKKAVVIIYNIVEKAIEQVDLLSSEKSIIIENGVEQNIAADIDAELFERVIINLLTNAIKFSEARSTISIISRDVDNDWFSFGVKDTGIGIPEDKTAHVFEKFGQLQKINSGVVCSTCLVLTVCKMAVEAHKGKIWVESNENKGTIFWIKLLRTNGNVDKGLYKRDTTATVKKDYIFNDSEKKELSRVGGHFKRLDIYEVSELRKLLSQIQQSDSKAVLQWCNELKETISILDVMRYKELIGLISDD